MANYIDGFVFPIHKDDIQKYKEVAVQVADIWKEYGAIEYSEYQGDDMNLEGVRSFPDTMELKENEIVIFGWVVFPSKKIRDLANKQVPKDSRMSDLVAPLTHSSKLIFDAKRMIYGGFKSML